MLVLCFTNLQSEMCAVNCSVYCIQDTSRLGTLPTKKTGFFGNFSQVSDPPPPSPPFGNPCFQKKLLFQQSLSTTTRGGGQYFSSLSICYSIQTIPLPTLRVSPPPLGHWIGNPCFPLLYAKIGKRINFQSSCVLLESDISVLGMECGKKGEDSLKFPHFSSLLQPQLKKCGKQRGGGLMERLPMSPFQVPTDPPPRTHN